MLIDWFTVGAQALNFLILVWLMKRFLYQPILHAIDTRERTIAAELADAEAKRNQAKMERDEFQKKNMEFDPKRTALLTEATDEANAERRRLLDEARKAVVAVNAKRREAMRVDARNLNQAIARRTQDEVFAIARMALRDLATTSLEERMSEVFTRRLRAMDERAKEALGAALRAADPAVVRCAFDVPAEQRATIQNALNETFSANIRLRFETAPDVVSGIELTVNGQKLAWSIAAYLTSLENGVNELLKEPDKPEAQATREVRTESTKPETEVAAKSAPKPKPATGPEAAPMREAKPSAKVGPKSDEGATPEPAAKALLVGS